MIVDRLISLLIKRENRALISLVIVALFLVTFSFFLLNFLPERILIRIKLLSFLESWSYVILIFLFLLLFLLIVLILDFLHRNLKSKRERNRYQERQSQLFNDSYAYEILFELYRFHPEPVLLPYHNQKVRLLTQYGLIARLSDRTFVSPDKIHNPEFPYVLQPIAEERLRESRKHKA